MDARPHARTQGWMDVDTQAMPQLRLGVQSGFHTRWLPVGLEARRIDAASSVRELVYSETGTCRVHGLFSYGLYSYGTCRVHACPRMRVYTWAR